jgi:type I site-specific restriction-modification system R (restriction) subunit
MKLYAKTIAQALPDWATIVTKSADLIEIEINDEHPNFQSLLEELETEIEPGIMGLKAEDLCSRLGIEMSNPYLHQLLEQAQTLISLIAAHSDYKQLLDLGYQPDLNIADAQTALTYLQWELDRNREPSV